MSKEYESPYCDVCGHCGYIGCCGVVGFIENHIKGKTNCKNEDNICEELTDMFSALKETEKANSHLQQENEQLKKEKQELIKLLKRRIEDYSVLCGELMYDKEFSKGKLKAYKEILNKLEGKE